MRCVACAAERAGATSSPQTDGKVYIPARCLAGRQRAALRRVARQSHFPSSPLFFRHTFQFWFSFCFFVFFKSVTGKPTHTGDLKKYPSNGQTAGGATQGLRLYSRRCDCSLNRQASAVRVALQHLNMIIRKSTSSLDFTQIVKNALFREAAHEVI